MEKKPKVKKIIFGISGLVLIVGFLLASSYYKKQRAEKFGFMAKENASTFVRDHSPTLGKDDAKVYLVEFTDPACETCAAFSGFIKQGMAAHPGKIKLVIRYAPFHEGSSNIVRVLEAAKKQGKYWETLDLLYKTQGQWTEHHHVKIDQLWSLLPQAGLDVEQIKKDMNDPEIAKVIQQDLADAQTLNVRKTPGFFVNGKPLETFGYQELSRLIQNEIHEQYPE